MSSGFAFTCFQPCKTLKCLISGNFFLNHDWERHQTSWVKTGHSDTSYLEERLQAEVCLACGIEGFDGGRSVRTMVKGHLALQETLSPSSSHLGRLDTKASLSVSLLSKQTLAPRMRAALPQKTMYSHSTAWPCDQLSSNTRASKIKEKYMTTCSLGTYWITMKEFFKIRREIKAPSFIYLLLLFVCLLFWPCAEP